MKIFGWKSAGGERSRPVLSRAAQMAAGTGAGAWWAAGASPADLPLSPEAQMRAGYLANPIVQRSVRLIADALGEAPLMASTPDLLALVRARSAGQALLATVAAQVLLHGNAYIQLLSDAQGNIAELYALRPERVRVVPDAGGWPVAYEYRVGERAVRLAAGANGEQAEVIHIRAFHPLDDHYGLGCLGAAAGAVAVHNAAARWNRALLDNAARPSGALIHAPADGGVMTRDQFERLRAEIEAGFAGSGNAGRPMLLEGGLRWQPLSLSPADMDFAGLKAAAAREIATAFGVPPMLIGLPGDATYANYREANRALWRQAILPLAGSILGSIAQGLRPWFAEAAISVDADRVTALAEDRERLWRQVAGADFLSREEKRAMLGFGNDVQEGVAA